MQGNSLGTFWVLVNENGQVHGNELFFDFGSAAIAQHLLMVCSHVDVAIQQVNLVCTE